MDKMLLSILKGFNFFTLAQLLYRAGGKQALERFLTVPENVLKQAPNGSRIAVIIDERDEFVEEAVEFIESALDPEFADPDSEDVQEN
jgi:hypothetical protein